MRGRINVNTAPRQVLAAAFEGLTLSSDQGIGAPVVDALKMADAVITNRPYSRLSDLHKASGAFANGTNYNPVVLNVSVTISNALTGTTNNYLAMQAMDRAREELFARTVNLFGTQSRAFRIYVVGEALDRATNPVSRVALEAAVQLEAQSGQTGLMKVIKWKKSL
jgi:type II secretory pathway component PulK